MPVRFETLDGRTTGAALVDEGLDAFNHENAPLRDVAHVTAFGATRVRMFEARAAARGCATRYLTTFSFQAPRLYRALGYQVAWEMHGFPQGIVKYEMVRTL